jgi:hypothetical protein
MTTAKPEGTKRRIMILILRIKGRSHGQRASQLSYTYGVLPTPEWRRNALKTAPST